MASALDALGLQSLALSPDAAPSAVTGTLVATESGGDSAALAGAVIVQGALAATESGSDSASILGGAPSGVSGGLAAAEAGADSADIAGAVRVSGALACVESGDDAASIGEPSAPATRFGGFEIVDTAPRLWWQKRKDAPAAPAVPASRKKAKELLREVVIDLARRHAEEAASEPASEAAKPAPAQVAEVRANVAPILQAVPGLDWQALYQRMYARALEDQQRAEAEALAAQEDEEAALLLLLA